MVPSICRGLSLINQLEPVQRRFTKRLRGLRSLTYERCARLGINSLELRRLHDDLTRGSKIIQGLILLSCDQPTKLYPHQLHSQLHIHVLCSLHLTFTQLCWQVARVTLMTTTTATIQSSCAGFESIPAACNGQTDRQTDGHAAFS